MSEVSYYNTFALVSLIVFILLVILDIIIWVKLDVRHYLAVLSGSEAKKSIDKIRQDAESGAVQADRRRRDNRAAISWGTSEGLDSRDTGSEATVPLQADPYATMVLDTINQQIAEQSQQRNFTTPGFVVEKEIVNTAETTATRTSPTTADKN